MRTYTILPLAGPLPDQAPAAPIPFSAPSPKTSSYGPVQKYDLWVKFPTLTQTVPLYSR